MSAPCWAALTHLVPLRSPGAEFPAGLCHALHDEEALFSSVWLIDVVFVLLPSCHQVQGAMAGAMVRIGDQLILEEDYDETYIPSEQGN